MKTLITVFVLLLGFTASAGDKGNGGEVIKENVKREWLEIEKSIAKDLIGIKSILPEVVYQKHEELISLLTSEKKEIEPTYDVIRIANSEENFEVVNAENYPQKNLVRFNIYAFRALTKLESIRLVIHENLGLLNIEDSLDYSITDQLVGYLDGVGAKLSADLKRLSLYQNTGAKQGLYSEGLIQEVKEKVVYKDFPAYRLFCERSDGKKLFKAWTIVCLRESDVVTIEYEYTRNAYLHNYGFNRNLFNTETSSKNKKLSFTLRSFEKNSNNEIPTNKYISTFGATNKSLFGKRSSGDHVLRLRVNGKLFYKKSFAKEISNLIIVFK